jgi:glycosyltransferase involved in cell wall biosynthesis
MRTILQVVPALNSGGVERTTIEVAEALTRAGDKALVASHGGRLAPELEEAGGELVELPVHSKNPAVILANAGKIAALAQEREVALIHARSRAPAWSALMAARRLKLPFVTTYHGIYPAKTPWKRAYNAVMAKGDIVIANSNFTRDHVIAEHKLDPDKVVAIPRGVDLARFDPAAIEPARVAKLKDEWRIAEGLVVLLPARIAHWKGQTLAIEATAQVLKRRPRSLTLVLAGDGRRGAVLELKALAKARRIAEHVRVVGHVADMPAAFMAADLVLLPSLEPEAFGRSAAEAQAMGVPVIVANHGGFTETVVHGETGLHAAPRDVDAFAAAIETLMDLGPDGRARMGEQAKKRARELYALSALQTATLRVYDRLLGDRRNDSIAPAGA